MGSDTRPSRRAKDAENSNSKGKQSSDKGLSASSSAAASDTSGLRRSTREKSAKKAAVAPSSPSVSVRKSERLENKSPKTTPPALRKSERVEKKCSPSPLRNSDKGKATISTSSVSKKSDQNSILSSMKRKKSKKEKSVKELTMETEEIARSETRSSKLKNKRPTGRSYKNIFKKRRKKVKASDRREKKQEKEDEFSEGDSNNCRDECDSRAVKLAGDDGMGENVNVDDVPEIIPESLSEVEKVKEPELVDSQFGERITEGYRSVKMSQDVIPSNRKRIRPDGECDGLVTSASKKVHTSVTDATSLTKDRGEHESTTTELAEKSDNHLQQKESPRDLQTGGEQNACETCKLGGKLLCCDGRGCKRSYHLSCLDPPMDDVPLGVWYCLRCVKKKLESGIHSVSEGAESIWDAREVEVLDVDGLRKEREFFVKYKGLAHIHNLWIPESKLLLDAPSLVAKFNRKGQVTRWKAEWTLPRRLLRKRLLMSPKQHDQYLNERAGEKLDAHYEWLVTWRGLDYEHVTWELDNASIFSSLDGQGLIKYYEHHRNMVNGDFSSSKADKILEGKNRLKPPKVFSGVSLPSDNNFSEYINKLHDFWLTDQNAVVIDEQERIMKAISLIQSFQPNAYRPFLIISTSAALYLWDDEFIRLAPHINVVVYSGNKDLRRSIRKIDFYGEGGCLILQVLITTLEIVMEDLDDLKSIEWELLIIDESQRTRISAHCAQIKLLATERRLLLISSQLKESTSEYLNLLSLLESHTESPASESLVTSSSDHIGKLKEKLSKYVIDRCKSDSSRFREYWVPVQLSNVQVEYYCAALISNSALLCSPQKQDLAGALQDLIKSNRKCCDHPNLVDRDTPARLYKDFGIQPTDGLDVDIKASGKLRLLDMMLLEMKKQGLRAVILFQDFERNSIGNILDDFLRLRFGGDSYECIVSGIQASKKQAVLDGFNNKESSIFVCLIETRACLSSIKLSSVDAVIIYGSDWNPSSDLRALQKITLDSQAEQIPVFRLYSSCTLEEKVLILAKQEKNLDCNLQNIGRTSSHLLLMWGASHQFQTLDKFHGDCITASHVDIFFKDPPLEDFIQDMLQIISSKGKDTKLRSSSIILNVQQIGGAYHTESSLPGELQSEADEGQPSVFWTKLLEGKHPRWKYIQESSQRNRKKVQHFEIEGASDEVVRKRRKVIPSLELGSDGKIISRFKEGACGSRVDNLPNPLSMSPTCINERTRANCTSTLQNYNFKSEAQRKLRDAQKSLHLSLKPNILKLCKILKFSDDAQGVVEEFLEYVLNNHHVSREPATILEAFQISLCWTVASMLKQKIDHKESVALVQQQLNFNCSKDEADFVYSLLRCIKGVFSYRTGKCKVADSPSSNEERLLSPMGLEIETKLVQDGVSKSIKEIQKKFQKKLNKLIQKQLAEKNGILRSFEEDKVHVEQRKRIEIAVIRSCFQVNTSMRLDKLKSVDISFAKEFEELESRKNMRLKKLEVEQLAARSNFQEKEAQRINALRTWAALDELLGKRPSSEPDNFVGEVALRSPQTNSSNDGVNNIGPLTVDTPSPEEQISNVLFVNLSEKDVHLGLPEMVGSNDGLENLVSGDGPLLEEQIPDTTAVSNSGEAQLGVPEMIGSSNGLQNLISGSGPLLEEQIPERAAVGLPVNEMWLRIPVNVSSNNGDAMGSVTQMSLVDQTPVTTKLTVPGGQDGLSVAGTSCDEVEVSRASEENDATQIAASNGTTGMNQQDRMNDVVDENSPLQELSLVNASSVQPSIAMIHGEQNATEEVERLVSQPIETALSIQSDHEAMVSEPAVQVHRPLSSNPPSRYNSVDEPLVGEVANLPSSEGCTLNPATELVNSLPMLNQAVSQPSTSSLNQTIEMPIGVVGMHFPDMRTSVASEFNSRAAQTVPTVPLAPPPLYPDSLHKELERLSKEFDQTCKSFEDKKLHLQSECEKEIAQIRLKYENQQQEADAEYLTKKEEFDDKHNKVWMNKILADAFRFKCMELRSSSRSGTQQDYNDTLMQQLIQISMQQNLQRPSLFACAPLTSSPAASLQASVPEMNLQTTMPAPITGPHITCPPTVHSVTPPPVLFQSAIARPPQIGSFSFSNGNQVSAQMRTRPPHLRSSTSRGLPALPNNISALELLRDVDRPPTALPSVVDGIPNTSQLNTFEFSASSVPVNPVCTSGLTDVVYLSDDD